MILLIKLIQFTIMNTVKFIEGQEATKFGEENKEINEDFQRLDQAQTPDRKFTTYRKSSHAK